ncbi:MAG: LLM class flavin-dependent oxidoreductase [Candidatus Odinarchaeia archaeon]
MPYKIHGRPIKFGLELLPDGGPNKPYELIFEYARIADSWFDNIWITHHPWNADPFTTAGYMASITKYTTIGLGATNPFVIPPVYIAETSGTLFKLYSKRFILGVGAGDPESLAYLNIKRPKKLIKHFRQAISEIRALLNGELVRGRRFSWLESGCDEDNSVSPKIFIAAQGPMMLKLAGEIGDGVLINASHPKQIKQAILKIKEGVEKAGKSDLPEIVAYTCFSMADSVEDAQAACKPPVAFIVAGANDNILSLFNIDMDAVKKIRVNLRDKKFFEAFELVDQEMIDSFSITGDPQLCRKKIEEIANVSVDQIVLGAPIGPSSQRLWCNNEVISKEEAIRNAINKILDPYRI